VRRLKRTYNIHLPDSSLDILREHLGTVLEVLLKVRDLLLSIRQTVGFERQIVLNTETLFKEEHLRHVDVLSISWCTSSVRLGILDRKLPRLSDLSVRLLAAGDFLFEKVETFVETILSYQFFGEPDCYLSSDLLGLHAVSHAAGVHALILISAIAGSVPSTWVDARDKVVVQDIDLVRIDRTVGVVIVLLIEPVEDKVWVLFVDAVLIKEVFHVHQVYVWTHVCNLLHESFLSLVEEIIDSFRVAFFTD